MCAIMTVDGDCAPAHIAIRHDDVRAFWFERIGRERVPWSSFWIQLFKWVQTRPTINSCAVLHSLSSEQELRERCQQVMMQICLGQGSQNFVSALDLNMVFIPNVSLPTRFAQIVAIARKEFSPDFLHSSLLQQAHMRHAVRAPVSNTPTAVFTSQHFGEPQKHGVELLQTISDHVLNLDVCCKSLFAVTGCARQRTNAASGDFIADCLSSDPETVVDDVEVQPSSYLASLEGALFRVRSKLLVLRTALQSGAGSGAYSGRPRVLSVVGPPLSGKSTIARALAVRRSSIRQTDTALQEKVAADECRLTDNGSVQPLTGSVIVVQLGQCHSLEESLQALGTALGVRVYTRDVCAALRLVQRGSVVVLDNADLVPCQHVADFIRLLLNASQVASIVVTSCSPKLKTSGSTSIVEIRPWHVV